jgi:uncharacterized membrane protein/plastocyanin
MPPWVSEGLNLFLRWAHLIAGIMWIGSSIFFHWMDSHLEKASDDDKKARPGLEGVLWMVHSGGFYEVEKKLVAPSAMPRVLHWFKWEAMFTWMTGYFLLVLLYHLGGGVLLVDATNPRVTPGVATAICMATLVVAWFLYDLLWTSPLAGKASDNPPLAVVVSIAGLAAIALGLTQVLSGRAAYIHTAAVMGTCMVANVWVRIIPAQKNLVESVKAGVAANAELAYAAKRRSKHNHYLTYPVLFIMISNHFPSTYGASAGDASSPLAWNWLILVLLCAAGAGVKLWMNKVDPPASVMLGALGVAVLVAAGGAALGKVKKEAPTTPVAAVSAGKPIEASGTIRGVVGWRGAVPPPREVSLFAGCEAGGTGSIDIPPALVRDGRLAEVFVAVASGVEGYAAPRRAEEIVVDQKACLYVPRVVGAQVGQPVTFVNSDDLFHNVRSVAKTNETFSVNMPALNQRETKVFRKPEVMVQTRCDLHPWMVAHIGVKDHPWFAVTGADGAFVLEGVPAGDVELETWHESGGRKTQRVTVPAGGEVVLELFYGEAG